MEGATSHISGSITFQRNEVGNHLLYLQRVLDFFDGFPTNHNRDANILNYEATSHKNLRRTSLISWSE